MTETTLHDPPGACYSPAVLARMPSVLALRCAVLLCAVLRCAALLCAVLLLGCNRSAQDTSPLPVLGHVPEFSLTTQDGAAFSAGNLLGKPHLVSFMFTRCPSICPEVLRKKKEIQKAVRASGRELHMVSISIDGENDTPEVLRAYAQKHGLDLTSWTLLTGDAQKVATHAESSFKIAVSGTPNEKEPHYGLTHGSHLVLVDAGGDIRGYYRSADPETPSTLAHDLSRLTR